MVEIIAEIGINHNGNEKIAHKMIEAAFSAGATTVKFQTVDPDACYKPDTELYRIFSKCRFGDDVWATLKEHAEQLNMRFLSTPSDEGSANLLDFIGVDRYKVASDSASNIPLIRYLQSKGKPLIVSTGMSSNDNLEALYEELDKTKDVIMHCVSSYPLPTNQANMNRMRQIKWPKIGYSDHTMSLIPSVMAVANGACIIEKHFKLNENCIDAPVSFHLNDFRKMVAMIREAEMAL